MARSATDYAIVVVVGLILVDGLMTLPYWQLEGNPIVLSLGPWGMMLVKVGASVGLCAVWFGVDGVRDVWASKACVWSLTALYAFVVVTNVAVLMA